MDARRSGETGLGGAGSGFDKFWSLDISGGGGRGFDMLCPRDMSEGR